MSSEQDEIIKELRAILEMLRATLEMERKVFFQLAMLTNVSKTGELEYLLKEILKELKELKESNKANKPKKED